MHDYTIHEVVEGAAAAVVAAFVFLAKKRINYTDERIKDLEHKHEDILRLLSDVKSNTDTNRVILEVVKRKLDL